MALLRKKSAVQSANLMVNAGAGCGKTTTIVWGCSGVPSGITLSDEQAPIIEHLQSEPTKSMRFTAFSKAIATELEARLPSYVETSTNHKLGLDTLKSEFGRSMKITGSKHYGLYIDSYGDPKKAKDKKTAYQLLNETLGLVSIAKNTLSCDLEASQDAQGWVGTIDQLRQTADFYSVEYSEGSLNQALEQLKLGFQGIRDDDSKTIVDFDDMVAGPAIFGIEPAKVTHGIVDETQDMNAAQLWLASHSCDRLSVIGDVNQSIFGFAGADPSAMARILSWMESTPRGSHQLPLMETRRCGKLIVEICQRYVPEFKAHHSNPDGIVEDMSTARFQEAVKAAFQGREDIMILCRTNAPLTRIALSLLKQRIPVYIKGAAFAKSITKLIDKLAAPYESTDRLLGSLSVYLETERTKLLESSRQDKDQKIVDLEDRCEIVRIFAEDTSTAGEVKQAIDDLFTDENKANAIPLSSVHRSKGLEADKVFIVSPELLPHPKIARKSEFNAQQERNLAYVGYSRAKTHLYFVRDENREFNEFNDD